MSGNGEGRLPLAEADALAVEALEILRPVCTRIQIAGSIRRMSPDIGDIELVCIPHITELPGVPDLFGASTTVLRSELDSLCDQLLSNGTFAYRLNKKNGKTWGSDLKLGLFNDFAIDICSATPETWGVTMAIKTGDKDFSHRLVNRYGNGLCPSYLEVKGWRVRRIDDQIPMDTPEEVDVFRALNLEYVDPRYRTNDVVVRRLMGAR